MATPPSAEPSERTLACPRCGTTYELDQEYCLGCGLRLDTDRGVVGTLRTTWTRRLRWYPGDWIWPVLVGLVVTVVSTAVVLLVVDDVESQAGPIIATSPTTGTTVPTSTLTAPEPTTTGTTTTPRTTTQRPARPRGNLVEWPARNGYTVVLASEVSRARAVERARAASRAGLPQVGVLVSSQYSSLLPGYYVVFSGIYVSPTQASVAADAAQRRGFRVAYARQVAR